MVASYRSHPTVRHIQAEIDELSAEFPSASIVGGKHESAYALLDDRRLSLVVRRPEPTTRSGGVWVTPSGQEFESVTFVVAVALGRPGETMRRAASRPTPEVGADVLDYFERLRQAIAAENALVAVPEAEVTSRI